MLTIFNYAHATFSSQPRVSTSSSQPKSLSEIAHLRRRKSTGTKAKSRSNTIPGPYTSTQVPEASSVASKHQSVPPPHKLVSSSKPVPTTTKLSHRISVRPAPPIPSPLSEQCPAPPQTNLKFSTADRTILEELKRNLKARESLFVMKGDGTLGSHLGSRGKKHHAYSPNEVPYPRNYEREVIDLDVWETVFCQDICESLTWHVFETPPTKVLDLGCGTGTWILNCARSWKNSHFVGLDIVPLQPDLQQVGSSELAARITWVHSNFLEGLPFPNDEFDFVHIKRIALGVPEDKWDFLFDEISRVMKPGAAFEMLEEDLFFPGKLIDSDSDSERGSDSEHRTSSFSSTFGSHSNSDTNLESVSESTAPSASSDDMSPPTPTTATLPSTPSRSNSPTERVAINEEKEAEELLAQVIAGYSITNEEASADMDIAIPDVPSPTIQPQVTNPKSLITQPLGSSFAGSAVSLIMSSVGSAAPPDSLYETTPITIEPKARGTRPRGYSLAASLSVPDSESHTTSSADVIPPVPLLLRTVPKPPANPRDHSLLESIYMKLLESRFINISPLALLANSIGLTFKDLRTHPPLQYRFPAIHHKPRCANDGTEKSVDYPEGEDLSDSDDARDAILPSPVPRSIKKRNSRRISTQSFEEEVHISEDNRYVDVRALMRHSSPYITLDEARASALSPSTKSMFPGISSAKLQRGSFLPNTTMNLDLKTLNLHLALRASEILACSESMWEWVLEYQGKDENKPNRTAVRPHRSGSGSVEMAPRTSVTSMTSHDDSQNSFRKSLLDLTRDEFNGLLSKFEMDMRDKCGLGNALEERFSWPSAESTPSPERKIFETACEKWDKWEMEQEANHHQRIPAGPYIATRPSPTAQQFSDSNDYISHGHGRGKKRVSTSSGSTLLPPTRRMSRAMRVFVAWNP